MTITTLRPASVRAHYSVAIAGGAGNEAIATNDNSDATWDRGTIDRANVQLDIDVLSAPAANKRIKFVQLRCRSAMDISSGHVETIIASLYDTWIPGFTPRLAWTLVRGSTSIGTSAGPIWYNDPSGVPWWNDQGKLSISGVIFLNVAWYASPVPEFLRVHELYVDVDINTQPVVTGTPTVANYVQNARPTVTWVYNDADNDPQTHYQIKMFDSATYGTGNFSPDTSTADYDSGDTIGNASSFKITNDLQADTYKAYVRVAQTWTDGSAWWSDWVPSAAFTVSFTTPIVPSLTVVESMEDQAAVANLSVISPMNLLTYDNSSFEGGIGQWLADSNCSISRVTTDAADGTASMQMSSTASGTMVARSGFDFLGDPRVGMGRTYTALASFKAAVSARTCNVGIRWIDIAGNAIGADVYGSNITDGTGGYTQATVTAAAPGNAVQAKVLTKVVSTGGAAEIHRVDKCDIHVGSTTVWSLGGMTTQPQLLIIERGERCDTRRGPAENWLHPLIASAGTLYQNHGYGFNWNSGQDYLGWEWLDKVIATPGLTPAGMLHWEPRTAAVNTLKFATWLYWPETDFNAPVVPNQTHIFSLWAWVRTGTFTTTPKIEWLNDANNSVNSTSTGTQVTLTTTPQRVSITATCPATASAARFLITNDSSSTTNDVFVTRLGWGLGTVPVDGKPARGGPLVWKQVRDTQSGPTWFFPVGFSHGEQSSYHDFECPPARPVLYRVRNGWQFAGNNVISANSTYAPLMMSLPVRTLLRSVTNPMLTAFVNRRRESTFTRVEDAQIYHPLGRDGGPVKIRDWVGGEDGQFIAVTSNETQIARLNDLVSSADTLQVQWAQGGRSYINVTDRSYSEDMVDYSFCDVDGTQPQLRYAVHTLGYVETQVP